MSSDGYGGSVLEHSAVDGVTAVQIPLFNVYNMLVTIYI